MSLNKIAQTIRDIQIHSNIKNIEIELLDVSDITVAIHAGFQKERAVINKIRTIVQIKYTIANSLNLSFSKSLVKKINANIYQDDERIVHKLSRNHNEKTFFFISAVPT